LARASPISELPGGYTFDLTEAIQWREKHLQKSKQSGNNEYEAARTEKEIYRAKMAKLNFERMDGALVPAKDVTTAAFEKARTVRDQLLNIPSRVSPILAAETNAAKVHEILDKEIRQALEVLSAGLNQVEGKTQCQN
jgi:phage terminase Nu1 subunit (DNA packaging protein)